LGGVQSKWSTNGRKKKKKGKVVEPTKGTEV